MTMIPNDPKLFDALSADAARQEAVYQPGPYWRRMARNTTRAIRRDGLADFRSGRTTVGHGFSDAIHTDERISLDSDGRQAFRWLMQRVFPFDWLFDMQVGVTAAYEAEARRLRARLLGIDPAVRELLARYRIPESTAGGCVDTVMIDGAELSTHYLELLNRHDETTRHVDMGGIRTLLEIGGGFGANVHLVLANHPNVRKVVYVDIPPTLYVGTQYLRAFYGDAVRDYLATRNQSIIRFRDDDALEIVCVPVWQLGRLDMALDLVYNAHSFVEMPREVVEHYASHCARLAAPRGATVLVSYDCGDPRRTLPPEELPGYFPQCTFARAYRSRLDGRSGDVLFVGQRTEKVTSSSATPRVG